MDDVPDGDPCLADLVRDQHTDRGSAKAAHKRALCDQVVEHARQRQRRQLLANIARGYVGDDAPDSEIRGCSTTLRRGNRSNEFRAIAAELGQANVLIFKEERAKYAGRRPSFIISKEEQPSTSIFSDKH